jgi:hypothetical protein
MASIDQITLRAAYNSLAVATLGSNPAWDAALTNFMATNCLQNADLDHGALSRANEQSALERMRLESLYGRNWRDDPRAKQANARLIEADRVADDAYHKQFTEPFWQAIRDLVLVPAPTIAAAVFKADLIHAEEAWNDSALDADCMQIIVDDFARLTVPSDARQRWDGLIKRYEAVEADDSTTDENIDLAGDLIIEIMATPAPHVGAVRWKLDHILAEKDGPAAYSPDFVEQLIVDYRRFLGEA